MRLEQWIWENGRYRLIRYSDSLEVDADEGRLQKS